MILMIAYTKVTTSMETKKQETETVIVIGGADGPTSLFLAGKLSGSEDKAAEENAGGKDEAEESILGPAEEINIKTARKEPYGLVVELDYVSANRISLHGNFGYMAFSLNADKDGAVTAVLENAVTLEELGGITMGGPASTGVLGGEGCVLIMPGIHNPEIARKTRFLYIEETNEITGGVVAPEWFMKKIAEGDYSDAVVEETLKGKLISELRENHGSELLYGPVIIPEYDTNTYGFLAENGENLENLWYGLWKEDLDTVTQIPLFE